MSRRLLWCCAVGAGAMLAPAAAGAEDDRLPGASSDANLWFVIDEDTTDGRVELHHHAPSSEGAFAQVLTRLPRVPDALAAWGSDLWMVFEPAPSATGGEREVYAVEVRLNPVSGGHYAVPADRLEVVPPLPGIGRLVAFVGTGRGPVALLLPPQHAEVTVTADRAAPRAAPDRAEATLLRLEAGGWTRLDLPADFAGHGACRMAAGGHDGSRLHLITDEASGPGRRASGLHVRLPAGRWTSRPSPFPPDALRDVVRVGEQVMAVLIAPEEASGTISYARPEGRIDLIDFDRPRSRWGAFGLRDGLRIIASSRLGDTSIQRLDTLHGRWDGPRTIEPPELDAVSILRLPVLLLVGVFAIILAVSLNPAAQEPASLPDGWSSAHLHRRVEALALDLVPGGILSMLILRCGLGDLSGLPLFTRTFDDSVPYIVMASITMIHSVICECLRRRTFGKALLGTRVVASDGSTPTLRRIILRNAVKTIVVMVPPLAVVSLMNPNRQGLHDLAGRTVVVHRATGRDDGDSGRP